MIDPRSTNFMPSPLNKAISDKFTLAFNIPKALKAIDSKFERSNRTMQSDSLQFSIWGSVVPSVNVPAVDMRYAGESFPISSHARPGWDPITVNFTIDNLWSNYFVIYQWLNLLRNDQAGDTRGISDKQGVLSTHSPVSEYSADMTIYGLDEYNTPRIKWTYTHAFPTNLGAVTFSEIVPNRIDSTFTFQFARLLCELV